MNVIYMQKDKHKILPLPDFLAYIAFTTERLTIDGKKSKMKNRRSKSNSLIHF